MGAALTLERERPPHFYCCRRVSNMVLICGEKEGRFPAQLLVGPDKACIPATLALVAVPSIFWLLYVAPALGSGVVVAGAVSFAVATSMYLAVACSTPGIVWRECDAGESGDGGGSRGGADSNDGNGGGGGSGGGAAGYAPPMTAAGTSRVVVRSAAVAGAMEMQVPRRGARCGVCDVIRPAGAMHCARCNACILKHDHHCPWTSKCIGRDNIHVFYAFLLAMALHGWFVMVSTVVWMMTGPA
ncbi:unnamed protein product [Phaeothamnion confervicola]